MQRLGVEPVHIGTALYYILLCTVLLRVYTTTKPSDGKFKYLLKKIAERERMSDILNNLLFRSILQFSQARNYYHKNNIPI